MIYTKLLEVIRYDEKINKMFLAMKHPYGVSRFSLIYYEHFNEQKRF